MEKYREYLKKMEREDLIDCSINEIALIRYDFASNAAFTFYMNNFNKLGMLKKNKNYKIDELREKLKIKYSKPTKDYVYSKILEMNPEQPLPNKNKGYRGQYVEKKVGLQNCSDLADFKGGGDLKTVTLGQTNAITQLLHMLPEIIELDIDFEKSKLYEKIKDVVWVIYDKRGVLIKRTNVSLCENIELQNKLIQDFNYIKHEIRRRYNKKEELSTINGPNNIIQIRTKAGSPPYTAMKYKGFQLYNKYMAFYYKANYVKELAKS